MSPFEAMVASELRELLHAGVTPRAVRLTVREIVVERIARRPLGAQEINDTVEAMVRAACGLVREVGAPPDLVDVVCGASIEAVRGHGGASARFIAEAARAASAVIEEQAHEGFDDPAWRWLAARVSRW
jgi:hypothetical protein